MGKIRILRRQGKAYIELPAEMLSHEELELFPLREGYYLLSLPLGRPKQAQRGGLSGAEKQLLKKLLAIRFERRTPAYVAKTLSDSEKEMLKSLEQRGHVNVFKGKKYKQGVYNINDRTYPLLKTAEEPPKKPEARSYDSYTLLKTQGYAVMKGKREAFDLSQRLKHEGKANSARGIKAFDGNYYFVTSDYLSKAGKAISAVLNEDMDLTSIAEAAKLDADGCIAVLRLMAENGEIIEKKRGVFAPI
jgi:hypothetical protein